MHGDNFIPSRGKTPDAHHAEKNASQIDPSRWMKTHPRKSRLTERSRRAQACPKYPRQPKYRSVLNSRRISKNSLPASNTLHISSRLSHGPLEGIKGVSIVIALRWPNTWEVVFIQRRIQRKPAAGGKLQVTKISREMGRGKLFRLEKH